MTLHYHQVKTSTDFEAEFAVIVKENAHALLVFPEGVTMSYRKPTAEFAAKYRLPSMFAWKEYRGKSMWRTAALWRMAQTALSP
jgi:anti-sigma-K factor RskA